MSQNSLDELQRQQRMVAQADLKIKTTSARQTAETSFGAVMKAGMSKALNTTAGIVSPFSPSAAAVLSAAVTQVNSGIVDGGTGGAVAANATTLGGGGTAMTSGNALSGGGVLATSAGVPGGAGIGTRGSTVSTPNDMIQAQFQLAELNQMFNLQYLDLQQKIQGENRQFTALSNVMKTKHDTAKNALNNLK